MKLLQARPVAPTPFAHAFTPTSAPITPGLPAISLGAIHWPKGDGYGDLQDPSGGFRTLVATNKGSRWAFVFGFPKNVRSNIDTDEEEALKKLATHLLSLTPQAIDTARRAGELLEVECDAQDEITHS